MSAYCLVPVHWEVVAVKVYRHGSCKMSVLFITLLAWSLSACVTYGQVFFVTSAINVTVHFSTIQTVHFSTIQTVHFSISVLSKLCISVLSKLCISVFHYYPNCAFQYYPNGFIWMQSEAIKIHTHSRARTYISAIIIAIVQLAPCCHE